MRVEAECWFPLCWAGLFLFSFASFPRRVHSRGFIWLFLRLRLGNLWPPWPHTPWVPHGAESRAAGDPAPLGDQGVWAEGLHQWVGEGR